MTFLAASARDWPHQRRVVPCLRMFVLGVRTGTWDAVNLGDRA